MCESHLRKGFLKADSIQEVWLEKLYEIASNLVKQSDKNLQGDHCA